MRRVMLKSHIKQADEPSLNRAPLPPLPQPWPLRPSEHLPRSFLEKTRLHRCNERLSFSSEMNNNTPIAQMIMKGNCVWGLTPAFLGKHPKKHLSSRLVLLMLFPSVGPSHSTLRAAMLEKHK